ncbi:unnamed protein product [Caenorhabditis sp. 36 PRJEB53466]|nr:unnamed protein product [Caenorhabditis sp. 36 PRJEB53466]
MIRSILVLAALLAFVDAMMVPISNECGPELKCPSGYKLFKRKSGGWCIKFFLGNMTWWEAERECRCTTNGAHLSGIESLEEKRWVEEVAQEAQDAAKINNGAVWIGAYRRKDCPSGQESTWSKNELCSDEKLFQFTDHHTCGTTIFQSWSDGQPTNAVGDDCAVILSSIDASGASSEASGKTANKNCLSVNGTVSILNSIAYICGVPPVQSGGYGGGNPYGGDEIIVVGAGKPQKKKNN